MKEIEEMIEKLDGPEQLIAIKCLEAMKDRDQRILNKAKEESVFILGSNVINLEKLSIIFKLL